MNENDFAYAVINHTNKFQTTIRKNLNNNGHIILCSQKWKFINLNPTPPPFKGLGIHKEKSFYKTHNKLNECSNL